MKVYKINQKALQIVLSMLVLALLLIFTYSFSYLINPSGTCYCNSCGDCSNALLDSACNEVVLTNDILLTSSGGTCIEGASYKTLDCNNSLILGDGSYGSIGISFPKNSVSFSVRNCKIENFDRAIHINKNSQICTIKNSEITNNGFGIRYRNQCPYSTISNVKFNNTYYYAVKLPDSEYSTLKNILIDNTGNPSSYSPIILENSPSSILENIKIINSYGGLNIYDSNGSTITNISVYNTTGYSHLRIDLSSNINIKNTNLSIGFSSLLYITNSKSISINNSEVSNSIDKSGVWISSSQQIAIENLSTHNNSDYGLSFEGNNSKLNKITSYGNGDTGIVLGGYGNNISFLTSYSQGRHGLTLYGLFDSSLSNIVIYDARGKEGIFVPDSENLTITSVKSYNNLVYSDSNGIIFSNSSNITIRDGLFENNSAAGISMPYNYVEGNRIINAKSRFNKYGIYLYNTKYTLIKDSYIEGNGQSGIYLHSLNNGTLIYNNYLNNSNNVDTTYLTSITNYWNTTLQSKPNIVKGSLLGGNFWSNPSGTGFSEVCDDNDSNGICDDPYPLILGDDDIDYYPLTFESISPSYIEGNIFFVDPTPPNNTILYNRDYLEVNATTNLTENYTKIILHLYNYTSYYSSYTCDTPPIKPCYYNFTSLGEDVYYILAELYMVNSTVYQSEVRVVGLTNFSLYCTP